MHGKRTTILVAAITLCCLALAAFVSRTQLLEMWWISRLSSPSFETRAAAAKNLSELGSDRAALALLDVLEKEDSLGDSAVRALGKLHAKCQTRERAMIIQGLRRALAKAEAEEKLRAQARRKRPGQPSPKAVKKDDSDKRAEMAERRGEHLTDREIEQTLCSLEIHDSEEVEALLSTLGKDDWSRPAAISTLLFNWKRVEAAVGRHLSRLQPDEISRFFRSVESLCDARGWPSWWSEKPGIWPGTTPQKTGYNLALACEGPEARAIALSHSIFGEDLKGEPYTSTQALQALYRDDKSPLVRTAAVRIAGYIGYVPDNLDLSGLLFQEKDPAFLKEVIEARTLQAFPYAVSSPNTFAVAKYSTLGIRLELWDGFLCSWLRRIYKPQPWKEEELRRLREILATEAEPALRDAASHALSVHYREAPALSESQHLPLSLPRLRVHEWGVFMDTGTAIVPAEKWLADLPSFVNRSQVSTSDLWRERFYSASPSLKPVIFFYSPEPAEVQIRVSFFEGRPWSSYPDATDYIEKEQVHPWPRWTPEADKVAPVPLMDREGISPPWIAAKTAGEAAPESPYDYYLLENVPQGEWRNRYQLVPWITPNHSTTESGYYALASMGLEWCGLRIGYGDALEGEPPPVDSASWWNHLRSVPSSPVALRGGREKFLFYDGAVQLRSPVAVIWTSEEKKTLRLSVRELQDFPIAWNAGEGRGQHPPTDRLPGAFVIEKRPDVEPRGRFLENLSARDGAQSVDLASLDLDGRRLRETLQAVLTAQGLTEPEASSLVKTWELELFDASGLRVITVLPRWFYDAALPISIQPKPGEIVRVGLLWKECGDLKSEEAATDGVSQQDRTAASYTWKEETLEISKGEEGLGDPTETPFAVDAESGEVSGLPGRADEATLSGDGTVMVFKCEGAKEDSSFFTADLAKKTCASLIRVPKEVGKIESFTASEDGGKVAFAVSRPGHCALEVIGSTGQRRFTRFETGDPVSWMTLSGDGKTLAFREGRAVVWVDVETGEARRLERVDAAVCQFLKLTSDGRTLFFTVVADSPRREQELHVADLRLGSVTNLGRRDGGFSYPSFTTDGSRVIVSRKSGDGSVVACLLDRRDGRLLSLAEHDPVPPNLPALSGDGTKVIYVLARELWITDVATGASRRCLPRAKYRSWHEITIDRAGKKALLVRSREISLLSLE